MKNTQLRKISKKKVAILFVILAIFIIIILTIFNCSNKEKIDDTKPDISQIFAINDFGKTYNEIAEKYGTGTDNYIGDNRVFATVYNNNKVLECDSINIFYYNSNSIVENIEYIINNNSIYEVLNKMKIVFGNDFEYNNETEELSTEFSWKYDKYLVRLVNNIENVKIKILLNY